MHHKRAGHDIDRLAVRAHFAATLEAKVDLGRMRMAVIRADLPGFPTRHRHVTFADLAEDLLDMTLRVPFFFPLEMKNIHRRPSTRFSSCFATQDGTAGQNLSRP